MLAVCEQERLTRVRGAGLVPQTLPGEAIDAVLALARHRRSDVAGYAIAEPQVRLPDGLLTETFEHHQAHAATAFLTSGYPRATILVCDSTPARELSVWSGSPIGLTDIDWRWSGPAFASLYSDAAGLLGFAHGSEHRLEGLAHLGRGERVEELSNVLRYCDGALRVESGWQVRVDGIAAAERSRGRLPVDASSSFQRRLGELLLELVADIRRTDATDVLCLGGGLFYNTYFTTLIRNSGIFGTVFVPINPGNAGLAVGAGLMASRRLGHAQPHNGGNRSTPTSPFLGPEYDAESIKTALDGCKLSYSFLSEPEVIDATVEALTRGHLVGWFQGRMEWGPRALGHRSILADPCSPYVLDNLNGFLRKRERWRRFGVSVCKEDAAGSFCGPDDSAYMHYEFGLRDDRLRHVLPSGATSIRVHTVASGDHPFRSLLKRMAQATGVGVLVNTSLNGFNEPIACGPRDAVRVFYGTGLDMLVIGRFILRK